MVVLREGVDRQFPIDRKVEHLLAQRGPPSDAPGIELVGQRSQVRGDVQGRAGIHCHPEESGVFRGRQFGQTGGLDGHVGEALAARQADQTPGVVVCPRVVRAGETLRAAAPRHHLGLAVQADVVERLDRPVGRSGQQNRSPHHRLGAVRTGTPKLRDVADELGTGQQQGSFLVVSLNRGVVPRVDPVLRGSEVGRLVARQLQGAPGQVDELVVIHRKSPAVECGPTAGTACIVDLNLTKLTVTMIIAGSRLSRLAANPLCYARCREFERPALGTEEITKMHSKQHAVFVDAGTLRRRV